MASEGLKVLREVLKIPTPQPSDPNYIRIVGIKKDAAISGVTARLKADENAFRKRKDDALADLYEQVSARLGKPLGRVIENVPVAAGDTPALLPPAG